MENKILELHGTLNVIGKNDVTTINQNDGKGTYISSTFEGVASGPVDHIELVDGGLMIIK